MKLSRRKVLQGLAAAPAILIASRLGHAADAKTIKISHQFPGGTIDKGDFRDRLTRKFAAEVEKQTRGALKFTIYPGASLMKVNAQFAALRRGALTPRHLDALASGLASFHARIERAGADSAYGSPEHIRAQALQNFASAGLPWRPGS